MPAERTISMPTVWAEDAQITIPSPPFPSTAYRDINLTAAQIAAGQGYATLLDSSEYNEFLYRVSTMLQLLEQNGILPWSQKTDYEAGAWVMGTDGVVYKATQPSGPNNGGFKSPPDNGYWDNASSVSNDLIYPGAFHDFYKQAPPAGWMVRDGALISSASTAAPKLYEALQLAENAFMLKSESQWQTLSSVAGGIGGAPFFVLNTGANTIRLPDTRGDMVVNTGRPYGMALDINGDEIQGTNFNGGVGDWHGDAIPNLTGTLGVMGGYGITYSGIVGYYQSRTQPNGSNTTSADLKIDTSLQTRVALENRTRAFAMLGCVYVGV